MTLFRLRNVQNLAGGQKKESKDDEQNTLPSHHYV